ncbi:MAG: nicotinate (nicotinamide) nucleotide adenylyltransferase [Planctomycetota bacterium]
MTSTPSAPGTPAGIAILGGSFNPPHRTHLRLAADALARLPVGEVRVIPAGDHPHKQGQDLAPAADRLAMCRLCFAGVPGVVVDDREVRRAGPSFTVDTVRELRADHPGRPLFLLIGSDNLPLLPTWRDWRGILALCTVVTWPRRGHQVEPGTLANLPLSPSERQALLANVLAAPADAVAASAVREAWRRGDRNLPELTTAVRDYIAGHGLYR